MNVFVISQPEIQKFMFRGRSQSTLTRRGKGQLNEVIVSPKMPTKNFSDFCPNL